MDLEDWSAEAEEEMWRRKVEESKICLEREIYIPFQEACGLERTMVRVLTPISLFSRVISLFFALFAIVVPFGNR